MINKISNIIIYSTAIILLTILLFLVINNINSVKIDTDYVLNSYKFLVNDNLDSCNGLNMYGENRVEYADLSDADKLCLAYRNIKQHSYDKLNKSNNENYCYISKNDNKGFTLNEDNICDIEIISKEKIDQIYYELFNKQIGDYSDFKINDSRACYYQDDKYLCGDSILQNITYGWNPTYYTIITKAKEKGSYLYIYDYFLIINNNECYLSNNGSIKNDKCSLKLTNANIDNRFLTKFGQKYKHTFKKNNNGTYYWISSEPI